MAMGVVSNFSAIVAVLLLVNVAIEARTVWESSFDYDYNYGDTSSSSNNSRQNLTLVLRTYTCKYTLLCIVASVIGFDVVCFFLQDCVFELVPCSITVSTGVL